jgi:hypothetical protein
MDLYTSLNKAIKKYDKNLKLILPSITDSRYFINENTIERTPSQYFSFQDDISSYITIARFEIIPKGTWENNEDEGIKFQLSEIYNKWESFEGFGKIKKFVQKKGLTPLYQSLNIKTLKYTHIYFKSQEGSKEDIWRFNTEKIDKLYYVLFPDEKTVFRQKLLSIFGRYQSKQIRDFIRDYREKYPNKIIKYLCFYTNPETKETNQFLMGTKIG